MTDYRVTTSWRLHPKRIKLQRALGAEGVLAIMDLWSYAAELRTSGELSGMDVEEIEIAAGWAGEPGLFVATVSSDKLRLLTREDGVYRIKDWEEHNAYRYRAEARKERGRRGAKARWEKQCGSLLDGGSECSSNAQALVKQCSSNARSETSNAPAPAPAPSPSPSPSPDPPPDPVPPPPPLGSKKQNTSSRARESTPMGVPMSFEDLSGESMERTIRYGQIDAVLQRIGGPSKGITPRNTQAYSQLCPVSPWELREAIKKARKSREKNKSTEPINAGFLLAMLESVRGEFAAGARDRLVTEIKHGKRSKNAICDLGLRAREQAALGEETGWCDDAISALRTNGDVALRYNVVRAAIDRHRTMGKIDMRAIEEAEKKEMDRAIDLLDSNNRGTNQ